MNEQLLGYLFDDKPSTHVLATPMGRWIGSSRRFEAFATTYRDKIRKKIRVTQSGAAIKELEVELETAYWLLQERRLAVAYESYSSEKTRGPDFAVTFKSITFNVEVTRIGSREMEGTLAAAEGATTAWAEPQQAAGRLMDTVCDKLGQMRPGMINVLMVATDRDFAGVLDLNQAMARLKERAERREAGLFGRYGFANTADFFRYYLRLSGVLVRTAVEQDGTAHSVLWANNQAKHAIPGPIRTILQR
ncbi:MAG TPA: hypothetical protein VF177_04935 [Anaerolineae bacterium]